MPLQMNCFRRQRTMVIDEIELPTHNPAASQTAQHPTTTKSTPVLRSKDIVWAEGLRGIAALGVLSNHLTLCYANYLFRPCCAPIAGETSPENTAGTPHFFQLPIFRLVAAGEAFVALFLVLTGFTGSHKSLSLARRGDSDKAYSAIAVSSFRRLPRLFLPATVATVVSWAVCNLGGYETARTGDAWWMIALTPTESVGPWGQSFVDLWWAVWRAWMPYGVSPYDQPQWALQYFVEAGFMVFLAVLGTARLSTWWRVGVLSAWAYWSSHLSVAIRDPWVGYCVLFGMVLAEMNLSVTSKKLQTKLASKLFGLFFVLIGLIAMSYPRDVPEKASWSFVMREVGETVLPFNNDKYKPWVSLGCLIMMFGVILTPYAQKALSVAPMVWLGKISFPLYLLHGTFIRSLFAWILFAGEELGPSARDKNVMKYPLPSKAWISFSVVCLLIPLFTCCHLWIKYLEPVFDRITLWIENTMLKRESSESSNTKGWTRRLKSTIQAILLVVRHGGLPARSVAESDINDIESEAAALLYEIEDPEIYSPTRLYAVDNSQTGPSPYRDSEDSGSHKEVEVLVPNEEHSTEKS